MDPEPVSCPFSAPEGAAACSLQRQRGVGVPGQLQSLPDISWLAEHPSLLLRCTPVVREAVQYYLQVPLDTPGVAAPGWRSASTPRGQGLWESAAPHQVSPVKLFFPFTIPSLASSGSFHSLDGLTYFSSFKPGYFSGKAGLDPYHSRAQTKMKQREWMDKARARKTLPCLPRHVC